MNNSYFVASNGSDDFSGTEEKPFRTLGKALEVSREESGKRTIMLKTGKYDNVSIALVSRDSGLEICAEGHAALYGGERITDWKNCGDGLYCADLPKNLSFSALSGWGIKLTGKNNGVTIAGYNVKDAGAGGISMRGSRSGVVC